MVATGKPNVQQEPGDWDGSPWAGGLLGDPVHLAEQDLHPVGPQMAEVQDAQQVGPLQLPGCLQDLLWKTRWGGGGSEGMRGDQETTAGPEPV